MALHPDGSLYVVDSGDYTLRRISASGAVSTVAGSADSRGTENGLGSAARFESPCGLAVGPDGSLYVVENHRVRRVR